MTTVFVHGDPVPKQSYRAVHGGGYTDPRVKAWQDTVLIESKPRLPETPISGPVYVTLMFYLRHRRRVDVDNLSKAVLDALNKFGWVDDTQIIDLRITKLQGDKRPGVYIEFGPAPRPD